MESLNIALLVIGGLVLVIGLLSNPLKSSLLSIPMVGLFAGVLLGPAVFGLLDLAAWGSQAMILEQAARLTIAISLMGIALRLPPDYLFENWRSIVLVLGPLMVLMWLASGLLVFVIVGLPFWLAMLVGAVITPTDPVIASTIVQGQVAEENLPDRVRRLLSGESGGNDGLAYPLVFLAILMLERPSGEALAHWLTRTILWEVVVAVALGALVGYGIGRLLRWAENRGTIEQPSYLAFTVALSLAVLGGAKLVGTDGILAVFAAGIALDRAVSVKDQSEEERIQEAVNRFFILPVFVLLGMALPWQEWVGLGWKGLLLVGAVLLLRRLPTVLTLYPGIPRIHGLRDALFVGWFGPVGVAALYYATLAERTAGAHEAWVIGSLVITASILAHGASAAPLTRLYGRRARESTNNG